MGEATQTDCCKNRGAGSILVGTEGKVVKYFAGRFGREGMYHMGDFELFYKTSHGRVPLCRLRPINRGMGRGSVQAQFL